MSDEHQPLWTEQNVRNVLGDERGYVSRQDAFNLAMRIIGHYESKYQHNKAAYEQLTAERDALAAELAERQASFDLRWDADMRAIAMWQEATGEELKWPNHADLCVWLMEQLAALRAEPRYVPVEKFRRQDNFNMGPDKPRRIIETEIIKRTITMRDSDDNAMAVLLPKDYRLCRLVPAQDTQQDGQEGGA